MYIAKIYNKAAMEEMIFDDISAFSWDEGNYTKNQDKHSVASWECEQVFFRQPLLWYEDEKHSKEEQGIYVLGQTDMGRKLFIVFTIRNHCIRVISARDMSRKERAICEKA